MKLWAVTSLGAPTPIRTGKNKLVFIGPQKNSRRVYKELISAGEREVKMYPFVDIFFGIRPTNYDMTVEHCLAQDKRGKRGYYARNGQFDARSKTPDTVATLRRINSRRRMVAASVESVRREIPNVAKDRTPDEDEFTI